MINYISSTWSVVSFLPYLHIYSQNKSALFVFVFVLFVLRNIVCLRLSVAVTKNSWVYFAYTYHHSPSLKDVMASTWRQELQAEAMEGREGCYWLVLACSGLFSLLC